MRTANELTVFKRLKREAHEACIRRGHQMFPFMTLHSQWHKGQIGRSLCVYCGKDVQVLTDPKPNEIDICGEAVALNCPWEGNN